MLTCGWAISQDERDPATVAFNRTSRGKVPSVIRIRLNSIMVDDQGKAEKFYTEVVGFKKKHDIPLGEFKWLTVVSFHGSDELELVLEPNANPAGKTYQRALFDQGIPATAFEVDDLEAEYTRLNALGVAFKGPPADHGAVKIAVFADTCGNWIQLYQPL